MGEKTGDSVAMNKHPIAWRCMVWAWCQALMTHRRGKEDVADID